MSLSLWSLFKQNTSTEKGGAVSLQEKQKSNTVSDKRRRSFLKALGIVGLGAVGASIIPTRANALVMGGTPSTSVTGLKNASNARINPATDDTLQSVITGNSVLKKTVVLTSSGTIHTPTSGKKLRIYATKFSLSADMTDISFRFTSGGTDTEKYISPRSGGLYGSNNHPNYYQGGTDEVYYCAITGSGNVQINIDYLEVT